LLSLTKRKRRISKLTILMRKGIWSNTFLIRTIQDPNIPSPCRYGPKKCHSSAFLILGKNTLRSRPIRFHRHQSKRICQRNKRSPWRSNIRNLKEGRLFKLTLTFLFPTSKRPIMKTAYSKVWISLLWIVSKSRNWQNKFSCSKKR
jgi:hypothetical protein